MTNSDSGSRQFQQYAVTVINLTSGQYKLINVGNIQLRLNLWHSNRREDIARCRTRQSDHVFCNE
nr:hypothetical protein [Morganella morganii]